MRSPWLELNSFHVLVGPNGSGKSTFLDAIQFVKDCLTGSPRQAVESRVPEFRDLTFRRQGGPIELDLRLSFSQSPENELGRLHYRLVIASNEKIGIAVEEELLERVELNVKPRNSKAAPALRILGKTSTGNDFYRRETGTYTDSFQFGLGKLALSLTPPDLQRYRTGNAVKAFLSRGIRFIQLDSVAMRQPAAATSPTELELDGTNLPRVVGSMIKNGTNLAPVGQHTSALNRWTEHLRYAIDDLESIGWAARQPDNAEYLILRFGGGLECPSWLLSDGTLRMLALTALAFLPSFPSVYMVEEPENGVHPYALEIILKALAAIPDAQVFVATHSPLVVRQAGVKSLLCFIRNQKTGVKITHGLDHAAFQGWSGTPDLASIFESRVLG